MTNAAVVGLGYWGPNLLRNLYALNRCERYVACDLVTDKLDRLRSRFPAVEYTTRFEKVLQDSGIHAVALATPVSTHYPLAKAALQAGKHVFVEKPFTANPEQGEELIALARDEGRILMVGHIFEYSPPVVKIKEILRANTLGQVFYLSSSRVNLGLHQKDVSVIWDLAPHDFSCIFCWLDEKPVRVSAMGKAFVQKDIPDVAFINLEFPSGCIANVQISWLAPSKLRRTTIVGSEKMLVYDDTQNFEKVKIFDKGVDYRDPETFGEYHLSYRSGDVVSPRLDSQEPLKVEMAHFLDCCETNTPPQTDGHNGLRVVKALTAAERSLCEGGRVLELA